MINKCSRCLLDDAIDGVEINQDGNCNLCTEFIDRLNQFKTKDLDLELKNLIRKVKRSGRGKKYDCVVGVSGGVDSSTVLVKCIELGLRPLAVHMDNGWNSELAQSNITNLIENLDVDLATHVIDWSEYRSMMECFFSSDVVDIELLYDNAMLGVNYHYAHKYGIKYIFSGTNIETEGMAMPEGWNWFKFDKLNIKDICRKNGFSNFSTFPFIGTLNYIFYEKLRGIKWISILNYIEYNKEASLDILEKKYAYKKYKSKHDESVFTKFYQNYLLPKKFGIDKRKVHLSNLIASGQLEKKIAEKEIENTSSLQTSTNKELIQYFLKKLDWDEAKLDDYLIRPPVDHSNYRSEKSLWNFFKKIYFSFSGRKFR
jgi:N-acetyl sugar amidotransferase